MKKLIRRLVRFVLLIIMIVIAFIAYHEIKYLRIEKWHPKYFMTIQGKIDPKIAKEFRFFMDYASSKRTCDWVNYIEGASGSRVKAFELGSPQVDQSGNFTLKIPLDRYYSWVCGWEPDNFGVIYSPIEYGLFSFSNNAKVPGKNFNILCQGANDLLSTCLVNKQEMIGFRGGYTFLLPSNKNYQINVSIRS